MSTTFATAIDYKGIVPLVWFTALMIYRKAHTFDATVFKCGISGFGLLLIAVFFASPAMQAHSAINNALVDALVSSAVAIGVVLSVLFGAVAIFGANKPARNNYRLQRAPQSNRSVRQRATVRQEINSHREV